MFKTKKDKQLLRSISLNVRLVAQSNYRAVKELRLLTSLLREQIKANKNRISSESTTTNHPHEPVPAAGGNEPSHGNKEQNESYEKKNYRLQQIGIWIQGFLCLFTALAFGAAAYYAFHPSLRGDMWVDPIVVGCITYEIPGAPGQIHHTGFVYEFKRREAAERDIYDPMPFDVKIKVLPKDIVLLESEEGISDAD